MLNVDDNLNHASSFSSVAFTFQSHNVGSLWYASMRDTVDNCKNCLLLTFSSITSIFAMTYNDVTWYNSSLWLTMTSPQLVEIQTLLFQFVVDFWICCRVHSKCTTSWHVKMLWICCGLLICCGFAVQLVIQQIHNKSYKRSLGFMALFKERLTQQCLHLPSTSWQLSACAGRSVKVAKNARRNDDQDQQND